MEWVLSSQKNNEIEQDKSPAQTLIEDNQIKPQEDSFSNEENKEKIILGQLIDLNQYEKGRLFAEFPLSSEIFLALQDKGFSVATRSQTAIIERILAQKSLIAPLGFGGSRFLPICIAVVEQLVKKEEDQ